VVAAAGLGQVDKCRMALVALTINGGLTAVSCIGSAGLLCVVGLAGFALEAFNANAQCKPPPPGRR
jgi:hypothetical protein